MRFNEYATVPQRKNTHLTHVEDLIFDGPHGLTLATDVLERVFDTLRGKPNRAHISIKYDGSPSIVFGPDPLDGRFFVATKSAFNVQPKLAHTYDEITAFYQNSPVVEVLRVALAHLPGLEPRTALQGDVLFCEDRDGTDPLRYARLNDLYYVLAKPNVLAYGAEIHSDTARAMLKASMGLVLHTAYAGERGTPLSAHRAEPLAPVDYASLVPFATNKTVFTMDASFEAASGTGRAPFADEEYRDILLGFAAIDACAVDPLVTNQLQSGPLRKLATGYVNYVIRQGWRLTDAESWYDNFHLYLSRQKENLIALRKTDFGRGNVNSLFCDLTATLMQHRDGFIQFFDTHMTLTRVKTLLLRSLNRAASAKLKPFIYSFELPSSVGDVGHEGFVVYTENVAVKLVDRPVFSHLNFSKWSNR